MPTYEQSQEKLQQYINQGRARSAGIVTTLMEESANRLDALVPSVAMTFLNRPEHLEMTVQYGLHEMAGILQFSQWSESQALTTLGIPQRFIGGLREDGAIGIALADAIMNTLLYRVGTGQDNRRLLRIVDHTVKGWLSPNYAIIDQAGLLTGFAQAIAQHASKGIVFTDGVITDRRYSVTAIWPQIFEPWPGEAVIIGADLQSSDYGFGAVDLKQKVIRLACINGALGISFFRKRHSGGRYNDGGELIGDNPIFTISDRTRELSSATTVSMLTDALVGAFDDRMVARTIDSYRVAANKTVNVENEVASLRKRNIIGDDTAKQIPVLINADIEVLPKTDSNNSALRFGQLLSMMARSMEGENVITLQEEAGKYYLPEAPRAETLF
jgi:hypothetical protein